MPAWRALRGAGSVTDRSCSLQRLVRRFRVFGLVQAWRDEVCRLR